MRNGNRHIPEAEILTPDAKGNVHSPDADGHFGRFGGRFVPETLIAPLKELEVFFNSMIADEAFIAEYESLLESFVGRPTPLHFARRLTARYGKGKIYFKREDLCHTGAHKINNTVGQILLARRLGRKRIIAETGAGQHGVATATVAAMMGLECIIYMGTEDMRRQEINVTRMRLLGAEVRPVSTGSCTLKDATNEALRDWVSHVDDTFYIIGSVVGPHPYPLIVRTFQSVIGREARVQILRSESRLPTHLVACVGGGSNALGLFHEFLNDDVAMIGVEAAGRGLESGKHAATLTRGTPGVLHGSFSYLLQDSDGQILNAHSISAGLDYPGVGPEHSFLKESSRVLYVSATDEDALRAVNLVTTLEGIMPALETAHALAHLEVLMPATNSSSIVIVNISGRGEKDLPAIMAHRSPVHAPQEG